MPGPKQGDKGGPSQQPFGGDRGGEGQSSCANDAAAEILRRAGEMCGFLVVAVVAPMGGGKSGTGECTPSPQQLALAELRRRAELRNQEEQNGEGEAQTPGA
jgi:hypothetical protein